MSFITTTIPDIETLNKVAEVTIHTEGCGHRTLHVV